MNLTLKAALALGTLGFTTLSASAVPVFPVALLDNSTGGSDSIFLGAPDDTYLGIGGQTVTYDFGLTPIFDGAGQDFNVYEVDNGVVEFHLITVLVSDDGSTFYDVTASAAAGLSIPGDGAHGNSNFKRSYNLGASPLTQARYLRVDGNGTGAAGGNNDFDLDAVGALNTISVATPDGGSTALLIGMGLLGLGLCRKPVKL